MSLQALLERFLKLYTEFRPVDATFMGLDGHDHRLPPADAGAIQREGLALEELRQESDKLPPGSSSLERLETQMLQAQIRLAIRELQQRPRHHNPAWFTGEAAFGLISLLLPSDPPRNPEDLRQRLGAIPDFLKSGQQWLANRAIPADWVQRARLECSALGRLLDQGLRLHRFWSEQLERPTQSAIQAIRSFAAGLESHPQANPACGEEYLEFLMREAHGLPLGPQEAEALALEGFQRYRNELAAMAAQLDPSRDWREQLAALENEHPALEDVIPTYQRWNQRALEQADAAGLVTPARDYSLSFQILPEWARGVAGDLYFLFYRSPPAGRASRGSAYWVFPPGDNVNAYLRGQNFATIKITHVVHHGSIGHHTQNARARASQVRLGRLAGTDCAAGIAMLSGGTTIEGWACYVQDLMLEAENFYTPRERLVLKHAELRNAAMCLGDLRLHRGVWNLEQMRAFYREEVGIAAGRAWSETTRNSLYPATRLMYWLGTQAIRDLREKLGGEPRAFHDQLLEFGSVPVAWVARELTTHPQRG